MCSARLCSGDSNNVSYILDNPQSMLVDYVRVWQGSGGSARASDVSDAPALGWWGYPPQFSLSMGSAYNISGVSLQLLADGRPARRQHSAARAVHDGHTGASLRLLL